MRNVGIGVGVLVMVAALAGCGGGDGGTVAQPSTAGTTTQTAVVTAASSAQQPPAEISTSNPGRAPRTTADGAGGQACRPDSAAIRNAAATLTPIRSGSGDTWKWDVPAVGEKTSVNDICSTLSAYLITIQGATSSSPMQVLLFHQGGYVGTAESNWNTFISPDPGRTTDDTVGLRYKIPGSCNACADGTYYCVQFHWDGSKVQMIGRPPEVTSTGETPGSTKC
ncbi:LppP/LprE family lipoprotein [Nocardia niigatensis]